MPNRLALFKQAMAHTLDRLVELSSQPALANDVYEQLHNGQSAVTEITLGEMLHCMSTTQTNNKHSKNLGINHG